MRSSPPTNNTSALEGLRIADFAWAWAGAYIATLLSFLGAEVIKVESAKRPDYSRRRSITTARMYQGLDSSPVYNLINLNKMCVTIDLSKPQGVGLVKEIVKISDVVSQNMRPGVMDKLGLGYEALQTVRPDVIYVSSSARGATGPERSYVGYAPSFAAIGGASDLTGYADGPPARLHGEIDILSAMTSTFALLGALNYRTKTGKGCHIDMSSSEAVTAVVGEAVLGYTMTGKVPTRVGNGDELMAPHNCYRCLGEDRWISIAISSDVEWQRFCEASGNPSWAADKRFADAGSRLKNQQQLDKMIEEWTIKHTPFKLMEKLQEAGIAAVPSYSGEDLLHDPHLKERGFWQEVVHPNLGKQVVPAPPWKLSETPARIHRHGPLFGEHNQYVFRDLLGMSEREISELVKEKVIY